MVCALGFWGSLGLNVRFCAVLCSFPTILIRLDSGIPSYASSIKHGRYPKVLRNLHYPAIVVDVMAMLFVLALVPLDTVLSGGNVLSILAETVSGHL